MRVRFSFAIVFVIFILGTVTQSTSAVSVAADSISFNRDIRPILSNTCFQCHGPGDHPEADLRLDILTDEAKEIIAPGQLESARVDHQLAGGFRFSCVLQ